MAVGSAKGIGQAPKRGVRGGAGAMFRPYECLALTLPSPRELCPFSPLVESAVSNVEKDR